MECILGSKEELGGDKWCLLGDFNSIRQPKERSYCISGYVEVNEFDDFMINMDRAEGHPSHWEEIHLVQGK